MSKYFQKAEYLKGREVLAPLTSDMTKNMNALLTALDGIREAFGKPLTISSGYRPESVNKAAKGSKNSAHLTCEAGDLEDPTRELAKFCVANVKLLEKLGLYMENPVNTPTWVHLQTRPTKKRIFTP